MKNYEMLYIISGDVTDKEVESKAKLASKVIEDAGGKIKNMDIGERKKLTYPIHNQDTGTYVNLIFELDPEKIESIKKELATSNFVMRHMISIIPDRKPSILLKPKKAKKEESGTGKVDEPKKLAEEKTEKKTVKKTEETKEIKVKKTIVSKAKKSTSKPGKSFSKTSPSVKTTGDRQDKTEITKDIENEEERLKKLDEKLEEILKD
ncbi:MAG: 30S ribosomal protein S6 [bacterium]